MYDDESWVAWFERNFRGPVAFTIGFLVVLPLVILAVTLWRVAVNTLALLVGRR